MASADYGPSDELRAPILRRSLAWIGISLLLGAIAVLLARGDGDFTPQVIVAVAGVFALSLVLISIGLVAILIEGRDLAELEARLARTDRELREAIMLAEEGAADLERSSSARLS